MIKKKHRKEDIFIRAAALLSAGLLVGSSLTVQAMATGDGEVQDVTYVYHKHIGDSTQKGGCFGTPVNHVHIGSKEEYGGCYKTPVRHIHIGNRQSGGACYGTAVLHEHEGNTSQGGKCYDSPVYHSHVDSCYQEISSKEYGCYTIESWDTSIGDDGEYDFKYFRMSCGEVVHGTNSGHFHTIMTCNLENAVVGYTLSCPKTTQSVDSYLLDCVKTEANIDFYSLSCNRTIEDIDSYTYSCEKDEDTPIGKIILTARKDSSSRKETVTAQFEDLTQGELQLSSESFIWYDFSGRVLGTGDTMVFEENGDYSVLLGIMNEDVNQDSLRVDVKITGIIKPAPEKEEDNTGDGEDNTGDDENNFGDNGDNSGDDGDHSGDGDEYEDSSDIEGAGSGKAEPVMTPAPTPTATPAATSKVVMNTDGHNNGEKGKVEAKKEVPSSVDKKSEKLPIATPTLRKETKTVTMEEKSSEGEQIPEIKTVEPRQSFLKSPVGRLITVTSGSLLLLTGLFTIIYLLCRSVKVYNDDGKGKMIYLGRCTVKLEEDGYSIEITDAIAEKSITNRYCIKPGLFALFKGEEEELVITKGQKRISVSLSREMIAII